MDLRTISEVLERKAAECDIEAENSVDYWLRHIRIDSEDFYKYVGERIVGITAPPFPVTELGLLMSTLWIDGFFHGMIAHANVDDNS